MNKITTLIATLALVSTTALTYAAPTIAPDHHEGPKMEQKMVTELGKTGMFTGIEVKKGSVSAMSSGGKTILKVSKDFEIPASPAPHWQVVDNEGNVYLLKQFRLVGDKTNREIELPSHIKSVAKVQVWCSFAEVVLGEAKFAKPISLR